MFFAVRALLLWLSIAGFCFAASGIHSPWRDSGPVIKAPDGDTLTVKTKNRGSVIVRLAGVDTPEKGQGYWRVARSHLLEAVLNKEVDIYCYKTDRYEREICRVKVGNEDLAVILLRAGLAWHYKEYASEQTAIERKQYAELELIAREKKIGLWSQPNPMSPQDCRRGRRAGEKCH